MASGAECMNSRTILWYLVFVGFGVNYMIRINANITIVAMVQKRNSQQQQQQQQNVENRSVSECFENVFSHQTPFGNGTDANDLEPLVNGTGIGGISGNSSQQLMQFSIERYMLDMFEIDYEKDGFAWNEYEQGLILGAFYWLHWVTQVPGGILARKYGTKLVFGVSNLIGCWLCFLMPLASYFDYKILIALRAIQGLITGLAWPAMHHMAGQWIPPNERSKFVTAYLGSSVGVALTFPLFGYIISWSTWENVFHFCGIFGTFWFIGWQILVFDTPAKHPRISPEERRYIEKSLGVTEHPQKRRTPWRQIFLSRPMWMTVIAQWGGIWGLFTLMTQAPTYFKHIHGFEIEMTGILSGLPHICRMIFALCVSWTGDYLLQNDKISRTTLRKLAGSMCTIVKGLFVLGLAYSGCDSLAAIVFLTIATAVHGAVSTGPLANIVDISPNYAGIVLGISGTISIFPGFVSPIIVGILTNNNQTIAQWKIVFQITGFTLIICGIMYVWLGDSSLQPWNDAPNLKAEEELETLRPLAAETGHGVDDEKDHKNNSNERIKCDGQKSIN